MSVCKPRPGKPVNNNGQVVDQGMKRVISQAKSGGAKPNSVTLVNPNRGVKN